MKNIFNPIYNTLINITAYSLLGAVLYLEFNESVFFSAGILIGVLLIFAHVLYFGKYKPMTKSQHLVFLIITISALFLMLIYNALTLKRSGHFLLILSLASLPPFYNFCGYARFTQADEKTSLLKYILGIMSVPFAAFLIYNFYAGANYKTLYIIVIVAAYYFVIFSLIKIAVIVFKEKKLVKDCFETPQADKIITFFLALVMPITGLILNQYLYNYCGHFALQSSYLTPPGNEGIFGDFTHPAFLALTLINGVSLLIPLPQNSKLRLPLFYLRSLGYSFVVYMFIIFLPVLPVGILTLFFIVGIYAFVPLLLAIRQKNILLKDYRLLKEIYEKKWIISVFVIGFLTLPAILTSSFIYDKANFKTALMYADEFSETSDKVDINALARTLDSRYASTYRARFARPSIKPYYSYGNIPIISGIYRIYIYGGKELDWKFVQKLEALFLDGSYYYEYNDISDMSRIDYYNNGKYPVRISNIKHSTVYDESIQAYRTWVDMSLKNSFSDYNEYKANFRLPDGVYVSDYYLYVGDEKKMGMLTDHRAAASIYESIVLQRLDPGILHYVDDNLLELRVFPFFPDEERYTGFELIHINDFKLRIDGRTINVKTGGSFSELKLPNAVLLSNDEIKKMPLINKSLDYNFILDCSEGSEIEELAQSIKYFCSKHGIDDGTLYLTTYRFEKYPLNTIYDLNKIDIEKEGGFNLNLAVKDVLKNSEKDKTPVIVFVTNRDENKIIFPNQIKDYTAPETGYYYQMLNWDLSLRPYSLSNRRKFYDVKNPITRAVALYDGNAVINNGEDKLVILNETIPDVTNNQYLDALALAAENRINMKNGVKNSLAYIRKSFQTHILTPSTAFIVVETKEQEESLLKLQDEILKEQENNESVSLSEPDICVMAMLALLCLYMLIHIKRREFIKMKGAKV